MINDRGNATVRRNRAWPLVVVLGVLAAMLVASPATPASPTKFRATITEDYVLLGCEFPVVDPVTDLCGTAKTKGSGKAYTETDITYLGPPFSFSPNMAHTSVCDLRMVSYASFLRP